MNIVQQRVPLKFGFNPITDIQVLAPMYNGKMGVSNLNGKLQKALNPPGRGKIERQQGGRVLRVGDKVMQVVNNYDKHVFNGDIGRITHIDLVQQTIMLDVDGAPVAYDFMELDELVHAYAISVHKSQGSEILTVPPTRVTEVINQLEHSELIQRETITRNSAQPVIYPLPSEPQPNLVV